MNLYNLYWKETDNIGDVMCGPSQYFPDMEALCIKNYKHRIKEMKDALVIIGGGGIFHLPSPDYNNGVMQYIWDLLSEFNHIIFWGIGHNVYYSKEIIFPELPSNVHLFSTRCLSPLHKWVPCVSCMSPYFNYSQLKQYDSVAFCHKEKEIKKKDTPVMFCEGAEFPKVVSFLGSAPIVYTNSYHGLYWSLLLGKTVIVEHPYSSKFYGIESEKFKDTLIYHPKPNYLQLCRSANLQFYQDVLKLKEELS